MKETSRPSTNENAAAQRSRRQRARRTGKRRRASSGSDHERDRRDREPPRASRRVGRVVADRDLERGLDRRDARPARRSRTCARAARAVSRGERTPAAATPPPTEVGAGIGGGYGARTRPSDDDAPGGALLASSHELDERNRHETADKRSFSPARIVALALIALARSASPISTSRTGDDPVSVPSGAHAGQLDLHACRYATEDGSYAADCGTLVVPENRHDPQSRLIALPVTRIRALSAHPGVPIFRLQGGPGITNMTFPEASRFAARARRRARRLPRRRRLRRGSTAPRSPRRARTRASS